MSSSTKSTGRPTEGFNAVAAWSAAIIATLAGTAIGYADQPAVVPNAPAPGEPEPRSPMGKAAIEQAKSAPVLRDPMAGNKPNAGAAPTKVQVDPSLVVDIHVNNEDLGNVLEMLSIQSQRNIVANKDVSARVTANLYGVTFYEALDAILHANGFGYLERGNFIYVYTLEQMQQIEQASRARVWKMIKLNYLNAIDAGEFAKPLLSEGAQLKTNGKTANFDIPEKTPIGADEFALQGTLVVFDYPENVDEIEKLIKSLDTRPQMVLVEATVLQTALNEANAFGVDFSLISNLSFQDFVGVGGPLKTSDALIAGNSAKLKDPAATDPYAPAGGRDATSVNSTAGNTAGASTMKVGFVNKDISVFLRVLDEVTDSTVLSNPKILALNRMPSRVLVGQRVGYLNTTSTDTATTQTVEFLDTGTQLYFRPFVTNEGVIRLELKPQVSTAVVRDVRNSSGATVTVPDEITNELVTNVMVKDGQTVVLGGLFREATKSTRRQVPLFGDIPLIGQAFRGNDDSTERNEIIFLITPTIVNDQTLADAGEKSKGTIERVRSGSREGMLFFSRDRMTSEQLIEAERLAAEGDTQKALWKVQQALSKNPRQPDALALREKLQGKKPSSLPTRSLLEDMLHNESATSMRTDALPLFQPQSFIPGATSTQTTSFVPATTEPVAVQTPVIENVDQTTVAPTQVDATSTNTEATTEVSVPAVMPVETPATPASNVPANNEQASAAVVNNTAVPTNFVQPVDAATEQAAYEAMLAEGLFVQPVQNNTMVPANQAPSTRGFGGRFAGFFRGFMPRQPQQQQTPVVQPTLTSVPESTPANEQK